MQPVFNFQGSSAILSILAFALTGVVVFALGVACVIMLTRRNVFVASRLVLVGGIVAGAYLLVLLGFSLASKRTVVEPGAAKYFCEIDCHLAYSVVGARRVPALGATRANGAFEVVTVRVWFDPRTIGYQRDDSPLFPNPRAVRLVDAAGRSYAVSPAGSRALEAAEGHQVSLAQSLRPNAAYTTSLVFELPANARAAELLLTESDPVTQLLIGHENSLLHPHIPFRLADSPRAARAAVRG